VRAHLDEIAAYQRGPLAFAIYNAIKNIVIFKEGSSGAAWDAVDRDRTRAARAEAEARVREEFAQLPTKPEPEPVGSDGAA
jgi:hypothetical protein